MKKGLQELATIIDSKRDWWRFPEEGPVLGFMGDGPIFIVGDQPSTSPWPPSHPNRRAFYDLLPRVGVARAHLTDLYKRRGRSGELREGLPEDFGAHLEFFRRELAVIKPSRIIALGELAEALIAEHLPDLRPILTRMWHFSHVVRAGKIDLYDDNLRAALARAISPVERRPSDSKPITAPKVRHEQPGRQLAPAPTFPNGSLCEALLDIPPVARCRNWTLREDNGAHFHNIVDMSESPLVLNLSWRPDAQGKASLVGIFKLNLRELVRGGFIRHEPENSSGSKLRLRIKHAGGGRFFVQPRDGAPRFQLPTGRGGGSNMGLNGRRPAQ